MKNIFLLLVFSISIACTPAEAPKKTDASVQQAEVNFKQPDVVSIEMIDRSCVSDSDCTTVSTKCSCSCGEGVSKNKLQKYLNLVETSCQNYQGPYCKVLCNGQVKCLEKVCTYVRS